MPSDFWIGISVGLITGFIIARLTNVWSWYD